MSSICCLFDRQNVEQLLTRDRASRRRKKRIIKSVWAMSKPSVTEGPVRIGVTKQLSPGYEQSRAMKRESVLSESRSNDPSPVLQKDPFVIELQR